MIRHKGYEPMKLLEDKDTTSNGSGYRDVRLETHDRRTEIMSGDERTGSSQRCKPSEKKLFCQPSDSIFDALDMDGVEEVDIEFERPASRPRPATFD